MTECRLTADELEKAGRALFGERWKSPLARALGLGNGGKDGSIRIREVMRGERPCPPGWTDDILHLLELQATQCSTASSAIRTAIKNRSHD